MDQWRADTRGHRENDPLKMLQHKSSTAVEEICGYTTASYERRHRDPEGSCGRECLREAGGA